jgi:hypothetical protein
VEVGKAYVPSIILRITNGWSAIFPQFIVLMNVSTSTEDATGWITATSPGSKLYHVDEFRDDSKSVACVLNIVIQVKF